MKVRKLRLLIASVGFLALSACGAKVSEGPHGLQSDGSYNLTEAERSRSCADIQAEMRRLADDTVLADTQTTQEVASSIVFGVLFGVAGAATYRMASDAGEAGKRAERNRAKLKALQATMQNNGCAGWDYQAHIAAQKAKVAAKNAELRQEKLETR